MDVWPNHALQRAAASRCCSNRRAAWPPPAELAPVGPLSMITHCGWTLTTCEEVESAGFEEKVAGAASEEDIDLIAWYPGFQRPVIRCGHG